MKRSLVGFVIIFCLCFSGCQNQNNPASRDLSFTVSNMADAQSREEVRSIIERTLPKNNVTQFFESLDDYNKTIQKTSLTEGFEKAAPEYDIARISELWRGAKSPYIGTNCRITTFMLLKGTLQIPQGDSDDALLFMDTEAIATGKLFSKNETEQFKCLFSRVKTENTEDISVHASKMREYFLQFKFNDDAKMISVVLHDNLDGDYLFIGHVGVMIENHKEVLFIEKLSFGEPYQALKFRTEEDCRQYLLQKYKDYSNEGSAKPFLMVNGEFAGNDRSYSFK